MSVLICGASTSFQIVFVFDLHSAYRLRQVPFSRLLLAIWLYFNLINKFFHFSTIYQAQYE
jgi:hypothetical protein